MRVFTFWLDTVRACMQRSTFVALQNASVASGNRKRNRPKIEVKFDDIIQKKKKKKKNGNSSVWLKLPGRHLCVPPNLYKLQEKTLPTGCLVILWHGCIIKTLLSVGLVGSYSGKVGVKPKVGGPRTQDVHLNIKSTWDDEERFI